MFGEKKDEKEKKKEEKKEDVMTSKFLTTLTWQVGKNEKTLVAIQVRNMPPHLPQNCVNCVCVFSSTILQSSWAPEFCKCAALVLTRTSFPKVRQVGISANYLGDGGSFRLVNLHTN